MKIRVVLITLSVIVILVISGIISTEYYTSQPEFCSSCHIMKNFYDSWAISKHNDVKCVVCHYAPGAKFDVDANFKGLRQIFTYFSTDGRDLRMPTQVRDRSCMTSECHPEENFLNKQVKFTEKVPYIHKTHEDKTIEGQKLHCDTCHQSIRTGKHFEVSKEICFLCHFKNTNFNEGRAKCLLCHEIPTKPLQSQKKGETQPGEKTITHQSLEKAKVPCQSCHYELVQGKGDVNKHRCFNCHKYSFEVGKKAGAKGIMHSEHVAGQHIVGQLAKCFDCHEPIKHQKTESPYSVRLNCSACHPDHHIYQKTLLVGEKRKGVPETPSLMYKVKTSCIGCHIDEQIKNGEKVLYGSVKACVACHTEKHEGMVKEWKDKVKEELDYAKEVEKEAEQAITNAEGTVLVEKLNKAKELFKKGQEDLHIVEYGSGVHNKKYSIVLLDDAMNNFEDLIDYLNEE